MRQKRGLGHAADYVAPTATAREFSTTKHKLFSENLHSSSTQRERRDQAQRSLGFVGLSAMIHAALILLLAAVASHTLSDKAAGVLSGIEAGGDQTAFIMDLAPSKTAQGSRPIAAETKRPMLADASDESAVELPREAKKPKIKAPVKPQAKPVVVKKAAPKPAPVIAKVKFEKPSKKPEPVQARDDGDVEVQQALSAPQIDEPAVERSQPDAPIVSRSESRAEPPPIADDEVPAEEQLLREERETRLSEAKSRKPITAATKVAPQPATAPANSASFEEQGGTVSSTTSAYGANGAQAEPTARAIGAGGEGQAPRSGGGAMTAGAPVGAVINADLLRARPGNPKPNYPQQDRLMRRQGTVTLRASVRADGSVANVRLERSAGSELMDEEAARTYYRWKYMPGQSGEVRKSFRFDLTADADTQYSRLRRQ